MLDRLQLVFGVKDDSALCLAMGTKRSTVGNWRNRGTIPYSECVKVAQEKNLSLDWLLTGEGPMFRGESAAPVPAPSSPAHNPREEAILALFRSLTEAEQREIQDAAEEKKRLTVLEQRVQTLEAVVADIKRPA